MSWALSASTLAVGSSSRSTSGLRIRRAASATRWASPPESAYQGRCAKSLPSSPTQDRALSTRSVRWSLALRHLQTVGDVVQNGAFHQEGFLREQGHPVPDLRRKRAGRFALEKDFSRRRPFDEPASLSSVLLPLPFGPMTPTMPPRGSSRRSMLRTGLSR